MRGSGGIGRRLAIRGASALVVVVGALCVVEVVAASNAAVGLNSGARESVSVPRWLYLLTGGAVVGASGLLASVVTDRTFIRAIHAWNRVVPTHESLQAWAIRLGRVVGVVLLALVIFLGFTGPQIPTVSFAVVVVFAGVRAGLTMVAYLVGNPWPVLNPWRTLVEWVPVDRLRAYPERWGVRPATAGLLAAVFVETAAPVATVPQALAVAVAGYTVYTLSGGIVFGAKDWFRYGDPLAVAFRFYGRVAPLRRTNDGLALALPGSALAAVEGVDTADVAFAVALIWELTFSGFVTTRPGTAFVDALAGVVPRVLVLFGLFVSGYALFVGAYWFAARRSQRAAETYRSAHEIGTWMAPPLLAIAAGYHLAHYFWLFVSNVPMLVEALTSPFSPPANPLVLAVPGFANGLTVAFVLVGHLLAVWIAHTRAYALFPSRLQAIRSQYPFVAVMIGYTVVSLWLISLPTAT
jgi:hypothetical protein